MRQETNAREIAVSANGISGDIPFDADHRVYKTVQITGTFTGTVAVVGSLDGTNYSTIGGPVTAPGIVEVTAAVRFISISGSSWGTGTAMAQFSSFNSRSDPG